MTFDEISELFRVEHKSKTLTEVRKDLYPAMAALIRQLKSEYESILAKDIDSPLAEGINDKRKKARDHARSIVDLRLGKISKMALRGSMGGDIDISRMTKEERAFYDNILKGAEYMRGLVDRLSGNAPFRLPDIQMPEPSKPEPNDGRFPTPSPIPPSEPVREPIKKPEPSKPEPEPEEIPDDWGAPAAGSGKAPGVRGSAPAPSPSASEIPDDWGEPSADPPDENLDIPDDGKDTEDDGLDRMAAMPSAPPQRAPSPLPAAQVHDAPAPEAVPEGGNEDEEEGTDEEMALDAEMGMPMRPASAAPRKKKVRNDLALIRILQDAPMPIAGPDRSYILKHGDVLYMPDVLALPLVQAGIAAEIKYSK